MCVTITVPRSCWGGGEFITSFVTKFTVQNLYLNCLYIVFVIESFWLDRNVPATLSQRGFWLVSTCLCFACFHKENLRLSSFDISVIILCKSGLMHLWKLFKFNRVFCLSIGKKIFQIQSKQQKWFFLVKTAMQWWSLIKFKRVLNNCNELSQALIRDSCFCLVDSSVTICRVYFLISQQLSLLLSRFLLLRIFKR